MIEANKFLVTLEEKISELREKLARLKAAKPVDQLTVDEVYEMKPELRESFQKAIANDNWSTDTEADVVDAKTTTSKSHH